MSQSATESLSYALSHKHLVMLSIAIILSASLFFHLNLYSGEYVYLPNNDDKIKYQKEDSIEAERGGRRSDLKTWFAVLTPQVIALRLHTAGKK